MRFKEKTRHSLGGKTGVEAIRATVVLVDLAAAMNVTPFAIKKWKYVPLGRVDEVSRLTGIPKQILRPDAASD